MITLKQLNYTQAFFLVIILAGFQFFFRLGKPVVREWDEATYGVNAYEMLQSGNPVLVTFNHKPDVYNSKPPLGLWLMTASIKAFGFNTFGLRFASALVSFLLSLFIFYAVYKTFHNVEWALFSSLILLGSIGFTGWHEARSGDFDAMVATFIFCYVLFFIKAIDEQRAFFIFYSAVIVSVACLCKGAYGLVALPGLLIFALIQKRFIWLLKQPYFYIGSFFFLITFLGYYALRESLNPGYLQAVWQNEIGERIMLEANIHKQPIPFYYHTFKLLVYRFEPFILLLPFAVYAVIKSHQNKEAFYLKGMLASAFGIWMIISFSATKLVWYDGSLYPILAFVLGWYFTNGIKNIAVWRSKIMAVLIVTYFIVFGLNQMEKDAFTFPYFLEEVRNGKQISAPILVYAKRYEHPIWFYAKQEESQGRILAFTNDIEGLKSGQLICTISIEEALELQKKFAIKVIFRQNENALYEIQERLHA